MTILGATHGKREVEIIVKKFRVFLPRLLHQIESLHARKHYSKVRPGKKRRKKKKRAEYGITIIQTT